MSDAFANASLSLDLRIADPRWGALGDLDALAAGVLGANPAYRLFLG